MPVLTLLAHAALLARLAAPYPFAVGGDAPVRGELGMFPVGTAHRDGDAGWPGSGGRRPSSSTPPARAARPD